jgi:DNA-binding transcriptional LysR family regulator
MNQIATRELECFVAVAGALNFSRAARQLNLSQPPLTRHIQALEEKLGARLLDRDTHGVALTKAGTLFLEDARAILAHLDRACETIRRAKQGEISRLRLAFIGALLDEKLVALIQRFRKAHPACQLLITDLAPSSQLEAIQSGELDGGFIGAKPARNAKGLECFVWNTEPLLLAVPEKHELSTITVLAWKHLRNRNWVMVSRIAAPAFRQQFSELAKQHRMTANIIHESDRVPAILTMVAAGNGVTIVPQAVTHLISKGVVFRALPFPQPMLDHAFAYRPKGMPAPLQAFVELLGKSKGQTKDDAQSQPL